MRATSNRKLWSGVCVLALAVLGVWLLSPMRLAAQDQLRIFGIGFLLLVTVLAAVGTVSYSVARWLRPKCGAGVRLRAQQGLPVLVILGALTGLSVALIAARFEWAMLLNLGLLTLLVITLSALAGLGANSRRCGLSAALLLGSFALWTWYFLAGPGYFRDYDKVQTALAALPDVEVLDIGYNADVDLEDIWVRLRVGDDGRLDLFGITPESFDAPASLWVGRVGNYKIHTKSYGYFNVTDRHGKPTKSEAFGFSLNVAAGGMLSAGGRIPIDGGFSVRNIPDLVANYDRLHAALERLALQTDGFHFVDPDGTTHAFLVRGTDADDRWR